MTDKTPPPDNAGNDPAVPLRDALEERYLTYALSTITSRALPDVRDGLKPVHRRILYAMQQLGLNPTGGYASAPRSSATRWATIHPHGDQSIYDALVRLAQDFSVRYPLIDGQGNFGNIDGDNACGHALHRGAADRDGGGAARRDRRRHRRLPRQLRRQDREPVVLPAAFPNLLANGSSGIAVGMATNIPPHNVDELCQAALHLIKHPNATVEKLVEFVPGPDFPTGGVLVDSREAVIEAYRTGRGSFRLRAKWAKEDLPRGGWQIVVTEIPYQVQKGKLYEKLARAAERQEGAAAGQRHATKARKISA